MNRKEFIIQSSLATAGAFIPFRKWWPFQSGTFKTLRRNTGIFTERGGTIGWLAANDGFVIVDSQFPQSAEHCLNGLYKKTSHALDVLINTHHHGDHTSGNPVLKPVAEKTVAHENVPVLMRKAADEDSETATPETIFTNSWNMKTGDETVHAAYYGRAHTAGDAVIYFERANVVHVGDLVFNRMNPVTDRPAGASIQNWINVLATIENEYPNDAIFIFGHGKPESGITGKKEDIGVMKNYLSALVENVVNGIEHGKTKKEIISLKTLPDFPDFSYRIPLKRNLEIVYAEITEQKWLPIGE